VWPSRAVYGSDTERALMVMPRSRSIGLSSSTCASISRSDKPPQIWMMRSASVDLPWSTCAMMEKLRMCCMGRERRRRAAQTRDYRTALPFPARGKGSWWRLFLGNGDRHEPAGAVARDQQQHGVAGLYGGRGGLERSHAVDRLVAHAQDHVAWLQSLLRRRALDVGDHHAALVLEVQLLAHRRSDRLHCESQRRTAGAARRRAGTHRLQRLFVARQLADPDLDVLHLAVARDLHGGGRAGRGFAHQRRKVGRGVDRVAVVGKD